VPNESINIFLPNLIVFGEAHEDSNPLLILRLLRAGRKYSNGRSAEGKRDKVPPSQRPEEAGSRRPTL
jgi:hypothetical protein